MEKVSWLHVLRWPCNTFTVQVNALFPRTTSTGIAPSDYSAIALKHWTSKLRSFSDLTSVHSFGFRGEALSSLCALGHLTVTTRTADQEV